MAKVKLCGLFRACDIDYANEALPDYIGFVFAKSRRQVSAGEAQNFRCRLHPSITSVGVFVNASMTEITVLCQAQTIGMVQLHGQENEAYIKRLKQCISVPIIKAVRVTAAHDVLFWQNTCADFLLLDNGDGGTGKAFDWSLIPNSSKPYFLAGGICAENLQAALALQPYAVDISSGAETDGVKNREKILSLVREARKA